MRFSHTRETTAAPGAVWNLWADLSRWPEWDEVRSAALLNGGDVRDGAEGALTPKQGAPCRLRFTEVMPGERYACTLFLPACRLVLRRSLEATDGGRTRFTHGVAFEGPLAPVFGQVLGRGFRRVLPDVMERLARLAEEESR